MIWSHLSFIEFLMRVIAGILFFFQGYDKLFRIKVRQVVQMIMSDPRSSGFPRPLVAFGVALSSLAEFAGGIFLIAGIFITPSLYLLGLDLLFVCLAFSFREPMWDTRHVFARLLLIVMLLLLPHPDKIIGLEYFIK